PASADALCWRGGIIPFPYHHGDFHAHRTRRFERGRGFIRQCRGRLRSGGCMTVPALKVTLHVCVTCRRGDEPLEPREARSGARFFEHLKSHAGSDVPPGVELELKPVECLSGCKRSCTVAVSAPGKWTFVIADLDPAQHAADI